MKKLMIALAAGLVLTFALNSYSGAVTHSVAQSVLRLHVIANSDSAADQALKLKVRDAVLAACNTLLQGVEDQDRAAQLLAQNINYIRLAARQELEKNSSGYGVRAELGTFSFPTKHYANISLPAGQYEGLRIVIGEGAGQNWWCVLYPSLCFVDEATGTADEAALQGSLTGPAYDLITKDGITIQFKFKLAEIFAKKQE